MPQIWNPSEVLGLCPVSLSPTSSTSSVYFSSPPSPSSPTSNSSISTSSTSNSTSLPLSTWTCVGTATGASGSKSCTRSIRPSEANKVRKLLAQISNQMPDQVDFNVLLHLARACLCTDQPDPHQGQQEANVIYEWTELMSNEATRLRSNVEERGRKPATKHITALRPTPLDDLSRASSCSSMRTITSASTTESTPRVIIPQTPSGPNTLPPSPPDSTSTSPIVPFPSLPEIRQPCPVSLSVAAARAASSRSIEPPLPSACTTIFSDTSDTRTPEAPQSSRGSSISIAADVLPPANQGIFIQPTVGPRARTGGSSRNHHQRVRESTLIVSPDNGTSATARFRNVIPPPLPTGTTIMSSSSCGVGMTTEPGPRLELGDELASLSTRQHRQEDPPRLAPQLPVSKAERASRRSVGGAVPAGALAELEEYNRLLQETQSRHESLLTLMADMRREMGLMKAERDTVEGASAKVAMEKSGLGLGVSLGLEPAQEHQEKNSAFVIAVMGILVWVQASWDGMWRGLDRSSADRNIVIAACAWIASALMVVSASIARFGESVLSCQRRSARSMWEKHKHDVEKMV